MLINATYYSQLCLRYTSGLHKIIKYSLVSRIFNSESLLMFLGKQPQPKATEQKSAATMNGKFSYCIVVLILIVLQLIIFKR